ncbi:hypothetical protein OC835_004596 [Tilletia horrida]|nr:hypothetical protein OC835_004596 [Tilletia horrida]
MLLIALFTLSLAFAATQAAYTHQCNKYVIISSRGTEERQGPSFTMPHMIANTLSAVPGGVEVDTIYPADWNLHSEIGAKWIVDFMHAGMRACPKQEYVLIGYSQGAMVSSLAIQSLINSGSPALNAIKAAVFLGNPFHVPGRAGNVDGHGGGATMSAVGAASGQNPGGVNGFAQSGRLLDICLEGDTVCSRQPSQNPGAHGDYGRDAIVQQMASSFLIKHLRN